MKTVLRRSLLLLTTLAISSAILPALNPALNLALTAAWAAEAKVPPQVREMAGRYTGTWTMYGIDRAGKIVRKNAWTDVVTAGDPKVAGNRAFVTTKIVMTFANKRIPPVTLRGREGYILKPDGSLDSYFIETAGRTFRMIPVAKNVWSYSVAANARELAHLGFPADAVGQHVLVKILTRYRGTETHRVTRLSLVKWKTRDGTERTLSFVSLKGQHVRQK